MPASLCLPARRYGKLNPATRTLDYPAFRPCAQGQQVGVLLLLPRSSRAAS